MVLQALFLGETAETNVAHELSLLIALVPYVLLQRRLMLVNLFAGDATEFVHCFDIT